MAAEPTAYEPASDDIVFTDAAAHKVGALISDEDNPDLKLRVFIEGGGCSGFQYGFTFDEELQDGDTEVENLGSFRFLVESDPQTAVEILGQQALAELFRAVGV